ncbi:MAG: ABC transporter substrate-binding protein [Gammaproteobacteria bacterium]|nr:ABC transporter substrate-binding protein [Gammaproteobacteria bacterium]
MEFKYVFSYHKSLKLASIIIALGTFNVQASSHFQANPQMNAAVVHAPALHASTVQIPRPELNPQQLLEKSLAKVLYFLSQPLPGNMDEVTNFVIAEVAPNFDFKYMSRWVAGRYYAHMPAQEKQLFTADFTRTFVTNMVNKIVNYSQNPPMISGFRSKQVGKNEAVVSADILYNQNQQVLVEFRYLLTRNGWKAVDIKANGMSALMYYRNQFAAKLRSARY